MKIHADSVTFTSGYCHAARVTGITVLITIGGIGGFVLFKAAYGFELPLILIVVLSISAMLAMSHGEEIKLLDKMSASSCE